MKVEDERKSNGEEHEEEDDDDDDDDEEEEAAIPGEEAPKRTFKTPATEGGYPEATAKKITIAHRLERDA